MKPSGTGKDKQTVREAKMRLVSLVFGFILAIPLSFNAYAAKYQEGEVAGGGTIQGVVKYNGPVKTRTVLPTKDKDVCGSPRKEALITVGDGGAVKDSVVFVEGIASGKAWGDMPRPVINNVDCVFEPRVQVAKRGKADILNSDPVLHNTHGYYGKQTAFNVALPIKDAKVTKILRKTGELKVDCDAHGWMLGWVYVVDNPYYMQTGADGSFTISDVPAGDYELSIWQEMLGVTKVPVSVKAGETTTMEVELGT